MEGSIECFDTLICSGARRLTGYQRRLFMAEVTTELCKGSCPSSRTTLRVGTRNGPEGTARVSSRDSLPGELRRTRRCAAKRRTRNWLRISVRSSSLIPTPIRN